MGNQLAHYTARVIAWCTRHRVPVVLENPQTSRLWLLPRIAKLIPQCSSDVVFDHCQFGALWRKPTRLIGWGVDLGPVARRCHAKQHLCSATQAPHVALTGLAPDGQFYTESFSLPLALLRTDGSRHGSSNEIQEKTTDKNWHGEAASAADLVPNIRETLPRATS